MAKLTWIIPITWLAKPLTKGDQDSLDFMYFLWCNKMSPVSGRVMKTFERTYLDDKETWKEPENSYRQFREEETTCNKFWKNLVSTLSAAILSTVIPQ